MGRFGSTRQVGVLVVVVAVLVGGFAPPGAARPEEQPPAAPAPAPASAPLETVEEREPVDLSWVEASEPRPNAGPLSPPVAPDTPDAPPTPLDEALAEARAAGEPVEVEALRTEASTVYANPSGTVTEETAAAPVRVATAEGWVPVDPTLAATADGVAPVAVPGEVALSGGGGDRLLELAATDDGEAGRRGASDRVAVDVAGELPAPVLEGATATYPGALEGSDVVVTASPVGAEVSVVIPDASAVRDRYELELDLGDLSVTQLDGGVLELRDGDGEVVGHQSAPVMFDASPSAVPGVAGSYGEVASSVEERDGTTVLVLVPDAAYLAAGSTQFPVTIDPLTTVWPTLTNRVFASVPTYNGDAATDMTVGFTTVTGPVRSFVRFNASPVANQVVVDAELRLHQTWAGSCAATPLTVQRSEQLQPGATWHTQPALVGSPVATVNVAGPAPGCEGQAGWKSVDVTSLVAEWAAEGADSRSVALLADETTQAHAKVFGARTSSAPPRIVVEYLVEPNTPSGLEPADGATVTTLRPTLRGTVSAPDHTGGIVTKFRVLDEVGAEVATHEVVVTSGTVASWSVPAERLRPGRTYTWTMQACTGFFPQACSATTTRSLTVNAALATGQRSFFTYDTLGLSDRSGLAVNVASGNVVVEVSELELAGVNTPLSLTRTYNSLGGGDHGLGERWSGSFTDSVRLVPEPDGGFVYHGPSGEAARITRNGDGTYSPSGDLDAEFRDAGVFGFYGLRFNHDRGPWAAGDWLLFSNGGVRENRLWRLQNRNGQVIELDTGAGGAIEGVVDTRSRSISYATAGGRRTGHSYGGRSSTVAYDVAGNLVAATDPTGATTTYGYDGHLLTSISAPGGRVVEIAYDARGRATSVSRTVSGVVETSTYVYVDLPVNGEFRTDVTDARGNTTRYFADHAHRVKRVFNAENQQESTDYDDNSNVVSVTDQASNTFTFGWDVRNNLDEVTLPTGATATSDYDAGATAGLAPYLPTSSTDAQGHHTAFTYDDRGNLTSSQNDLLTDNTSSATYQDEAETACSTGRRGQVCSTTDALGRVTSFTYDGDGNLVGIALPGPVGDLSMTYDGFSRTQSMTDGKGQTRSFAYDGLDRLTAATYAGGHTIAYGYDGVGNATSRDDAGQGWAMAYDEANRLLAIDGPAVPAPHPAGMNDVAFTYDPVGNLASLTDVGGTTDYTYTTLNMVATITDPDAGVTTYRYDDPEHGTWLTAVDHANGARSTMGYDQSGRLTEVVNRTAGGQVVTDEAWSYRSVGDDEDTMLRTEVVTPSATTEFAYDALNRLESAVTTLNGGGTAASYGYAYDGVGNRTSETVGSSTRTFAYDTSDQLTGAGVVHDANGNMTAGGSHGYAASVFNALDQAESVTPRGGSARSQAYGGQLQSSWLADDATRFTNAGSVGITAISDGGVVTSVVRDPSGRLVSMERGGDRFHYLHDGRGSVDGLTDGAGGLVQRYRYEPYGRLAAGSIGVVDQPFRWNGEYAFSEDGYKIGARWYDTGLGRWTQRDPAAADPHPYAYANNDPINNIDPTGLWSVSIEGCFKHLCAGVSVGTDEDGDLRGGFHGGVSTSPGGGGISVNNDDLEQGFSYGASCGYGPVSQDLISGSYSVSPSSSSAPSCSAGFGYVF